jgi:hypothetical protein
MLRFAQHDIKGDGLLLPSANTGNSLDSIGKEMQGRSGPSGP